MKAHRDGPTKVFSISIRGLFMVFLMVFEAATISMITMAISCTIAVVGLVYYAVKHCTIPDRKHN